MIDMVFLTHLHHDHVAGIDLFPQALFVYSRKEWEYANMTSENAVQKASLSLLHAYRRRLIEKDGEEIIPGVTAMFTPGHSPGGVSYVLDMNGEKWILTGDAIKNRSELANREVDMTSTRPRAWKALKKCGLRPAVCSPGTTAGCN
jgi:glyoxylase-like metal-dependent hydrolase (beta-lactamase superfamily II)